MKKFRNVIAFALALFLTASLMPMAAFADEEKTEENTDSLVAEAVSAPVESSESDHTEADADDSETDAETAAADEEEADETASEEAEESDERDAETAAADEEEAEEAASEEAEESDETDAETAAADEEEADEAASEEVEESDEPDAETAAVDEEEAIEAASEEVEEESDETDAETAVADEEEANEADPEEAAAESGMPLAPEAFSGSAPEAPVSPVEPDLSGLSDEEANEKIRVYNEEVNLFNEAVERYNAELDAYEAAAEEYNASVETYNERAASYNAAAEEHNQAEQQKLDAYDAAMEEYNKKASTYINYQAKIDAVSDRNLTKAEGQMESLGDILRADKDSILTLGTVLEEDYTVRVGRRTNTLGHAGDLVISWDDLAAGNDHSTILIQEGEPSEETYKVANLHIFQDFADFSEMNDYQSERGWDCMNINVDDENGVIIIPKALIDRIAMIEIEVAEVGKNDTVTVVGQNSVFESTYITTVGRFFEGYTDGPYWYSAGSVFQSTAVDSESDWTGTGHTFSYSAGTTDRAGIKNPLNVNNYVFQRYNNPYTLPEKPEEVNTTMMDKAESLSFVEILGSKLSHLQKLSEREIQKEEIPDPIVPIIPEIPVIPAAPVEEETPDEEIPAEEPEQVAEEPVVIPAAPVAEETPVEEILAEEPEQVAEEPVEIPAAVVEETPVEEIPAEEPEQVAEEPVVIPAAPVVEEIPDEEIPLAAPELIVEESTEIPAPEVVEIPDEEIPLAAPELIVEESTEILAPDVIEIPDEEIPLAALELTAEESAAIPASGAAWALVNLIACLLTVLLAVVKLVGRHEKEDNNEEKKARINLSFVIPAVASVILFILTENMRNPMVMFDSWTPVMLALLAANCLLTLVSSLRSNREYKTDLSWKIG